MTGTVRYVSPYDEVPFQGASNVVADSNPSPLAPSSARPARLVASSPPLVLSAASQGFHTLAIFGSVLNVFIRIAPYAPAAAYGLVNYNYNYHYSGATGTQFNLGARYTFK